MLPEHAAHSQPARRLSAIVAARVQPVSRPRTRMPSTIARRLSRDLEHVALVLQGGGALGAYQAGVFEQLSNRVKEIHWVAGVSIGAINAALIAGNAPAQRLDALHAFWNLVSSGPARVAPFVEAQRSAFNQWSSTFAATIGVPGFYRPRVPPALFQPDGTPGALGIYDVSELRSTLERLVDFDRINAKEMRFSVGAVNVATGNSAWFDNHDPDIVIGPEHVMASGALPPAFPPVQIDGESYWDGGVLSNTPLQYVLDNRPDERMLVVQIDLFPARGPVPINLAGVMTRHKDITYSSRSRFSSAKIAEMESLRGAMRRLIGRLPENLRDDPDLRSLKASLRSHPVDIVHLIYRQSAFERESKDYEFSRPSIEDRWAIGVADMKKTYQHLEQLEPTSIDSDVTVYDLAQGFDAAPGADRRERDRIERAEKALDEPAKRARKPRRTTRTTTTKRKTR